MIETAERGTSPGGIGPPSSDRWEDLLEMAAAERRIPRSVLLSLIVNDWLQGRQCITPEMAPRRHGHWSAAEHLRARMLARIADRHVNHRRVTATELADRFGLAIEATQSMLAELVTAGLLTASLEPTTAGRRHLREYHGIGRIE
jgi:hypothetical protein